MLKKEFQKKDVERMRNLISGNKSARTSTGIGYDKAQGFHDEGDTWEEDGRNWTIKDGIKQNVTILDKAREKMIVPLFCPKCTHLMKGQNDKLFYLQYNRCFECQIQFETKLKGEGKWKEYETSIINSDIDNFTKEYEGWFDDHLEQGYDSVSENGSIDKWHGSSREKMLQTKKEVIDFLQKMKK